MSTPTPAPRGALPASPSTSFGVPRSAPAQKRPSILGRIVFFVVTLVLILVLAGVTYHLVTGKNLWTLEPAWLWTGAPVTVTSTGTGLIVSSSQTSTTRPTGSSALSTAPASVAATTTATLKPSSATTTSKPTAPTTTTAAPCQYGTYGPCSVACGDGVETASRVSGPNTADCPATKSRPCHLKDCPPPEFIDWTKAASRWSSLPSGASSSFQTVVQRQPNESDADWMARVVQFTLGNPSTGYPPSAVWRYDMSTVQSAVQTFTSANPSLFQSKSTLDKNMINQLIVPMVCGTLRFPTNPQPPSFASDYFAKDATGAATRVTANQTVDCSTDPGKALDLPS